MIPLTLCAEILAHQLPELENQRRAVALLARAGYEPRATAPIIDVIVSLARDLRAELADVLDGEFCHAG